MRAVWLDFETYYDDEYSLKKMTPAEYIADQRFEALNCAFVWHGEEAVCIDGPSLPAYFDSIDWSDVYAISHNALFDMLILSMRYNTFPKMYGDTLAMARNWISHSTGSVSLAACAKYYGLDEKWGTVAKTKGVNYELLASNPDLHREVRDYAIDDTMKCKIIFTKMMQEGFPAGELETIDTVIRMAACPQFEVDLNAACGHLGRVQAEKAALLARCNMDDRSNLMRDEAFMGLLMMAEPDIRIPRKISKTTGKEMFAFAKTDKEFTALLEHDNPEVQALVAARLGHKSTLEETRTTRIISIGRAMNAFPIPLKYSGAHTHRFSGDWSINAQNLPRTSDLRRALRAPKGKKVVSIDASQIEARINATISNQWDLVEAFAQGRDVYCEFASLIYKTPVNKDMKLERFVGKTGILSLGYSSSPIVFQNMLRVQGGVNMALVDAVMIVGLYRETYSAIVRNWYTAANKVIPVLEGLVDHGDNYMYGPVQVKKNKLVLPNGNHLYYRDMHTEQYINDAGRATSGQVFMRGNRRIYTYGAKIVENVVQSLAFVHIMDVAKRVGKLTGGLMPLAHQVHDELIYIVDDRLSHQVGQLVRKEMSVSPEWMPRLPLAAAYKIGDSYGDMKEIQ